MSSSNMPPTQMVEGLRIPAAMSAEVVKSAIHFTPRDGDIFVASFPKCGTNWTHYMLNLILRHGEPFGDDFKLFETGRFIELLGVEGLDTLPSPRTFVTHLPFHLAPRSDRAKYIYVTRNPKDTCVSAYHHFKNMPSQGYQGTFDEFFEHFLVGDIEYGDFFDHLEGWYQHRNDANVLFLTYEEIKENQEAAIFKIASFVNDEKYAKPLRKDRQKLESVLKHSSFKEMKPKINKSMEEFFANSMKPSENIVVPEEMKEKLKSGQNDKEENAKPKSIDFIRKGIIGDWRNHFSEDQSRRMDEKFAERTKNIQTAEIWKQFM